MSCEKINDCGSNNDNKLKDEDERFSETAENELQTSEKVPLIANELTVYKQRWLMLFIFSLNTAMCGAYFISLAPVNDVVAKYYRTTSVEIEWLSNMCILFYVLFSLPSTYCISKWGIRPVIIGASFLNFICGLLHYPGYKRDRFWLILFGQMFTAIAYAASFQITGKLSSLWFPEKEQATATSIGVLSNILGVAIGFAQPALMIKDGDIATIEKEIKCFYISQIVISAIILIFTFAYKENPPTSPNAAVKRERVRFRESIRYLWQNKYFIFLSQSYGIYFGLYVAICVLINPFIASKFDKADVMQTGWMGFWNNILACVSFVLVGRLLDKYRNYQLIAILLNLFSMIIWLTFVLVLNMTKDFKVVFAVFVLCGVWFIPYFAAGIEQAAEMTYPVSEELSTSVISIVGNTYGFVFIYTLGVASEHGYTVAVEYIIVGLYMISTIFSCLAKTRFNRSRNP